MSWCLETLPTHNNIPGSESESDAMRNVCPADHTASGGVCHGTITAHMITI